jgi:hypothetical protein
VGIRPEDICINYNHSSNKLQNQVIILIGKEKIIVNGIIVIST